MLAKNLLLLTLNLVFKEYLVAEKYFYGSVI